MELQRNVIYNGDCRKILAGLPDASVNCVITSPPYWALRDYKTEAQVWDGKAGCRHEWAAQITKQDNLRFRAGEDSTVGNNINPEIYSCNKYANAFCSLCGAWRGSLGLESSFELYIKHLADIFDEVKRVLRGDGTLWVNLGDTYYNDCTVRYAGKDAFLRKGDENYDQYLRTSEKTHRRNFANRELPSKSLCLIPERFAIEMVSRGWILRNKIIWYKRNCLGGGTVLYARTQKGFMPSSIKDLARLRPETVQLWDGKKWQQVREWIENRNPQNVRDITFRNGEIIKCTGEHLFPVVDKGLIKASDLRIGDIVENITLPNGERDVQYIPDEMGWFLGAYLADGSIGDKDRCLQFASNINEQARYDKLREIARQYDAECYRFDKVGNSTTFNIYSKVLISIVKTYIAGKSARNKHLTNKVWQRSGGFLDNILMGYLEGDGYYDRQNNRYRLGFTRNNALARDLRLVCARLGYAIKLQKSKSLCGDVEFKTYKGEIRKSQSSHANNKSGYEIVNIAQGKNIGKFWDVVLEQEPHLFATHSGLLAHNCMPSSAKDRFTVDFEDIFFFTKSRKYWFERQFEPYIPDSIRPTKINKNNPKGMNRQGMDEWLKNAGQGRNMRCVWDITTKPFSGAHFAVFPEALIEPMVKAGCPEFVCRKCGKARVKIYKNGELVSSGQNKMAIKPRGFAQNAMIIQDLPKDPWGDMPKRERDFIGYADCGCNAGFEGGVVLDLFAGSGTAGLVALRNGRGFIEIDLSADYCEMNKRRKETELGFLAGDIKIERS